MSKDTDIRILDVSYDFEEYQYRTPLKFGGVPVNYTLLLNVQLQVQTRDGKEAAGLGSMTLSNVWAFPPRYVPFDQSLEAMRRLSERLVETTRKCNLCAHPVDLSEALEPEFLRIAADLSAEMQLATPIPKLCTVVTASPIDAAIHDGFGKANGINSYDGLSADFMSHDLSRYLNDKFAGKYLDQYTLRKPKSKMPLYHLVGALDPLTDADIPNRCLLYTSPSPRDRTRSRMPSSA